MSKHQESTSGAQLAADAFRSMDRLRLARGRMLDLAGFGPKELPHRMLHAEPGLRLRAYGPENGDGPALLIVPAPIKKFYIWDLSPEVSVVRRCLDAGMQVYLAEWIPDPEIGDRFGLEDYASRLLGACQQAIEADSGERQILLAGHSLGGLLAAIYSCLHPELVRALVLLEAPLHFAEDAGSFAPLVARVPDARPIAAAFGQVPGSFLNMVSAVAAPHAFQWERFIDRWLASANPRTMATHLQVERWSHDEFPLPGKLFSEIVEWLYREDRFMRGMLAIGGRSIGPADLHAPLLNVVDPRSTVIPPESVLPFHAAAASRNKRLLEYEGDIGVNIQHVGVLVGANAHARLWPVIIEWLGQGL